VFFDDYPLFYESSDTAASPVRLNLRHEAMITSNQDILAGARVLDLASHDGRWSFAALRAGAEHVIGVEARAGLVDAANKTFAEYGVPTQDYEFVQGDMFRILQERRFDVDVVMCLGFIYHTLRYGELFRGTKIILGDEPLVRLNVNRTKVQSHAAQDDVSYRDQTVAGWPSLPALKLILDVYGLAVEDHYDWPALLARHPKAGRAVRDYVTGNRVTLRCRAH
jgi:hypothetical protein